jgi:O-antigen biosynthesis protein
MHSGSTLHVDAFYTRPFRHLPVKSISPQIKPVVLRNSAGDIVAALRVEKAAVSGLDVSLMGWTTESCTLKLFSGDQLLKTRTVRQARPDVAQVLKLQEPSAGFGFQLIARLMPHAEPHLLLRLQVNVGQSVQSFDYPIRLAREGELPDVLINRRQDARGRLTEAFLSNTTGDLVVHGWLVAGNDAEVWLESDAGQRWEVAEAYRFRRQDLNADLQSVWGAAARLPGLLMRCAGVVPCTLLKLMKGSPAGDGATVVSEIGILALELNPVAAARRLFAMDTPIADFAQRAVLVDEPVLAALLAIDRAGWPNLPVWRRVLGRPVADPVVTVVIPLYGRLDFVESQLLAFAQDDWLQARAQLVYVLDDERLVDAMTQQAEQWFRLYGVPFEWVFGGVNRGFSGANNLGAAQARGEYLVFLNSDAFPVAPGWLEPLCQALADDSALGVVGARLVFPDGSLQHASMDFLRREELGVWINHHPLMGCPVALDPHRSMARVPAVTGACMAMRRTTLDAVGGWDTGYLVGDFEDSDMCFKVRAAGLDIGYLPTVALTHLERQSFKMLGQGDFRQRVVIFNAALHQRRWGEQIAALSNGASA